MHRMTYTAACDCEEANKRLRVITEDPITIESSCGGEISQDWLKSHIKTCDKCKQATSEGNMP